MTFIEALTIIIKTNCVELCNDEDELSGKYSSICVYDLEGNFIGKLRWPKDQESASVDEDLENYLKDYVNLWNCEPVSKPDSTTESTEV